MNRESMHWRTSRPQRRGAIGKGCLIGLAIAGAGLLLLLMLGGVAVGAYNGMVKGSEDVGQKWAQVESQYKRRFDLVPNLVATVEGAADFERSTITQVTEARASVGKLQLPSDLPSDPAQLQEYMRAQAQLGSALSRLLVVAENYPQLRATENFRDLQVQLEGTENRIAVAREDFTIAVKAYNTRVRGFPGNLIAGMYGFEPKPQLDVPEGEQVTPKVDFGAK